jgi:hypothetical protein
MMRVGPIDVRSVAAGTADGVEADRGGEAATRTRVEGRPVAMSEIHGAGGG